MYSKGVYHIYDDRNKVQSSQVKSLLKEAYWANKRDVETIQRSLDNSICFSLYHDKSQIGFGRVVTDFATIAYISDVIIHPEHRGKGLGKWLIETIVKDFRWEGTLQVLVTDDAHSLYKKFGFSNCDKLMGKNFNSLG
jgi:GNAT superfamily N-acetyltransferase